MAHSGISILDLVINTMNRLSGIPDEAADTEISSKSAGPVTRPALDRLLVNDINSIISRQSGSFKRKRSKPSLSRSILKRQIKPSLKPGDRTYIGCQLLPRRCNRENMLDFDAKTFCGTFEQDGDLFVLTVQDHSVRIFDTRHKKWEQLRNIAEMDVGWSILDTSLSPNGKFVAYSSWSDCLRLSTLEGEQTSLHLEPEESRFCVFSLQFTSDGEEIVCGGSDCRIYVYNLTQQKCTLKTFAHNEEINAVAFGDTAHSRILYTGGDDGLIRVWDRRTLTERKPQPVGVFAGHQNGITFIESKGDERYLISNSKDQSIKLWDVRHFASEDAISKSQRATGSHRWDYRWQPVPKRYSSELSGDVSIMTYKGHQVLQTLIRCRFSPMHTTGQRYIYTGSANGRIYIYDLLTGQVERCFGNHKSVVRDVSWHPYLPILRSSSFDGVCHEWIPNIGPSDFFDDYMEDK